MLLLRIGVRVHGGALGVRHAGLERHRRVRAISSEVFVRSLAFLCEYCTWRGQMEPRSGTAFAMGVLQHLTGLALNVLVFAIVCTSSSTPSRSSCLGSSMYRETKGVPYLLIRLGN